MKANEKNILRVLDMCHQKRTEAVKSVEVKLTDYFFNSLPEEDGDKVVLPITFPAVFNNSICNFNPDVCCLHNTEKSYLKLFFIPIPRKPSLVRLRVSFALFLVTRTVKPNLLIQV